MFLTEVPAHLVELRHGHGHRRLRLVHLFFVLSILSFRWLFLLVNLVIFLVVVAIILALIIITSLLVIISILLLVTSLLVILDIVTSVFLLLSCLQEEVLAVLVADHFE